jgi:hypothetical protein
MMNKHQRTVSIRDDPLVTLLGVAINQHALQIYKSFMEVFSCYNLKKLSMLKYVYERMITI